MEVGGPGPNSQAAPDQSAQARALATPWMWWSGRVCRMRSVAVQPQAAVSAVAPRAEAEAVRRGAPGGGWGR